MFISDIRNCQNKEQERLRVDKELGKIRIRFKNEKVSIFLIIATLLAVYYKMFNLCSGFVRKWKWRFLNFTSVKCN